MGALSDSRSNGVGSPPAGEIQKQLQRVLASEHFNDAPRLSRFLDYIVDQSLAGRKDRLKGYAIGLEVFDRPDDFDPQIDTIVRVQACQMRKRLDLYYANEGINDALRIRVPKGKYTPEFIVLDAARMPQPDTPPDTSEQDALVPTIAVLPFDNYSGNADDQFFADGLTEETIANLARFRDLFVYSRSTTTKMARDGVDIPQLHDEQGVDFIIEGSVRKSASAVRVTVQLIDASTEGHLLAEQFERPCTPEGVFEIQDDIAQLVAGRVASRHGPLGRHVMQVSRTGRSRNWDTYLWTTRFYDYYRTHDPETHRQTRDGLSEALRNDATSSDGWAALSIVLLDEYRLHLNERPGFAALDHALDHARRAVTCDPDNAFAHQALALCHYHRRESAEFRLAGERAIKLNPGHSVVLADIGHCYCMSGEWDFGLPLIDRATDLSPVHPGWYHHARALYCLLRDEPEAGVLELKNVPMPMFHWYVAILAALYGELGRHDEAGKQVEILIDLVPDFTAGIRREFDIWCVHPELADKLIAAWRKAGLEII